MTEFVAFLSEVFAEFGAIQARRMFGGYGIFHDGLMFALVADDVLYLKSDAQNRHYFTDQDLTPFTYQKKGRSMTIAYYTAPDEIYDDPAAACEWAHLAFQAALRSHRPG
jgi:DNA transformation protein